MIFKKRREEPQPEFVEEELKDNEEHISRDEIVWTYDIPLKYAGKKIVRGHNPVDTLVLETNNININTKCGYGGFLTGIILDDVAGRIIDCVSISEEGTKVSKQST